jgi:hypothetical protein
VPALLDTVALPHGAKEETLQLAARSFGWSRRGRALPLACGIFSQLVESAHSPGKGAHRCWESQGFLRRQISASPLDARRMV